MSCGRAAFLQIHSDLRRSRRVVQGNAVQTDDRIHGRTDLMAHIGEESRFGLVGLLRCMQRIAQCMLLFDLLTGLRVHIHKAGTYITDDMVVAVFRTEDTGETDRLIGNRTIHIDHIAEGNDPAFPESFPDGVRLDKPQEFFPVLRQDIAVAVSRNRLQVIKMLACVEAIQIGARLVAHAAVTVQFHIIDAAEVGSQGRDHFLLLLLLRLLVQQLLLKRQPLLHFRMPGPVLSLRGLLLNPELCILPVLHDDV